VRSLLGGRPMRTRPFLAVLLAVALAGCGLTDPTTTPGPTPPPAGEAPTTATMPPGTTYAPNPAGKPADDCPLDTVECPRPWVTPGAVIPSTKGVCTTAYNPRRELSDRDKVTLLIAYGMFKPPESWGAKPPPGTPNQTLRAIIAAAHVKEFDHLYPNWAGGRSDPSNVWPQVDAAQVARKDALETRLYHAVCTSKTMSLAEARRRAARFWAYWPARFSSVRGGGHD